MSFRDTLAEIHGLLEEINDQLEACNAKMSVLAQRVRYYTKTVSKRR
jgi:hypothetical protein